MLPSWVTGALRCPSPLAGTPRYPPQPLSGPPSSSQLSGTHSAHSASPKSRPRPHVCSSAKCQEPISICPRPRGPQGALASRRQGPAARPARGLGCVPLPRSPFAEAGGRRAVRTQERPSCRGRKCDVSQAGPAPPPAAADTGVAGAARGVRQGCQASLNKPGGRYLVGGHRAEALEDGQDILLAGVPHSHQRTEAQLAQPTGKGRSGAVAASRSLTTAQGVGLRVTARPSLLQAPPHDPAHNRGARAAVL